MVRNLSVCVRNLPPYATPCYSNYPSNGCNFPGIDVYPLYYILQSVGIPFRFTGSMDDQNVTECDAIAATFMVNFEFPQLAERGLRSRDFFQSTSLVYEDVMVFIAQVDYKVESVHILTDVFNISVIATSVVFLNLLWILERLLERKALHRFRKALVLWEGLWLAVFVGVFGNCLAIHLSRISEDYIYPFKDMCSLADHLLKYKNTKVVATEVAFNSAFKLSFQHNNHDNPEKPRCVPKLKLAFDRNPPQFFDSELPPEEIAFHVREAFERWPSVILIDYQSRQQPIIKAINMSMKSFTVDGVPNLKCSYRINRRLDRETKELILAAFSASGIQLHEMATHMYYWMLEEESGASSAEPGDGSKPVINQPLQFNQLLDILTCLGAGMLTSIAFLLGETLKPLGDERAQHPNAHPREQHSCRACGADLAFSCDACLRRVQRKNGTTTRDGLDRGALVCNTCLWRLKIIQNQRHRIYLQRHSSI